MKKIYDWVVNFFKTLDWAEVWRYFVIGVCSTVLNFIVTFLLKDKLSVPFVVANIIAWLVATMFAFFANTFFVFKMKPQNAGEFLAFMGKFFGERVFTLGVEELITLVFFTWLAWPAKLVKAGAQCVVIALNYIISKFIVYKNGKKAAE